MNSVTPQLGDPDNIGPLELDIPLKLTVIVVRREVVLDLHHLTVGIDQYLDQMQIDLYLAAHLETRQQVELTRAKLNAIIVVDMDTTREIAKRLAI